MNRMGTSLRTVPLILFLETWVKYMMRDYCQVRYIEAVFIALKNFVMGSALTAPANFAGDFANFSAHDLRGPGTIA